MNNNSQKLTAGDYFERILIFVGLVVMVSIVQLPLFFIAKGGFSTKANYIFGALYLIIFAIFIWIALIIYNKYVHPAKRALTWQNVKWIVLSWISFLVIEVILGLLNQVIYHVSSTSNNEIISQLMTTNHLTMILMGITAVFFSPILEELVFRGFLIGAFFNKSSRILPVIVSGVLFSTMHMEDLNVISFVTYALLGMILAYLYIRTDNIKVSIGLHFLNNLFAMGMMAISIFTIGQ